MEYKGQSELEISVRLQQADICSREEWDMLVFLHRRYRSLLSMEYIAQSLGYQLNTAMAALSRLQAIGLIERSPLRRGIRLWQLSESASSVRAQALHQLLTVGDSPTIRRLLARPHHGSGTQIHSAQERYDVP